ncbi:asparagine synthase (glutamine-hydrolyzing) [Cryomorphaceae bacterium 1068]|nr:asparagine synthase (glutamine-hydrolyzing) [Cryomorphaceae bacterium 1068]
MPKKALFVYFRPRKRTVLCGIAGIWSKKDISTSRLEALSKASEAIAKRGPDAKGKAVFPKCALAHRRLSIIDTDSRSDQPMKKGSHSLIFNGEIYNYKELKTELTSKGYSFQTKGDTEVLLIGLIEEGVSFLKKVNGFFAFGFYSESENRLIIGRDRYGIKPLYYHRSSDEVIFGSSLGTVMPYLSKPEIDQESLSLYLGLSYIPFPKTILSHVHKLAPGTCLHFHGDSVNEEIFYELDISKTKDISADEAKKAIREKLTESVRKRMVSDVPLGTFLSGGVDSSIITQIASQFDRSIPAFSIGFPDQPYFDESQKAAQIAKHLRVDHHILEVTENDLDRHLDDILNAMDEPFADSSGILVNMLSEFARKKVKVSLSGDGADELFGGYNKHRALLRSMQSDWKNGLLKNASPLLDVLPSSRNHKAFDRFRKIQRYSKGLRSEFKDRYLEWACFTPEKEVAGLIKSHRGYSNNQTIRAYLDRLDEGNFNSVLETDFALVLANDMLCKVDGMSMHRSLEVRVPFLDHELVDYVFSLPAEIKLNNNSGKILLKEAFANEFPKGFFSGSKRGFEAPLTHWFKGPLRERLERLFKKQLIEEQGLFDYDQIQGLIKNALSRAPGDSPHTLWALLVFQHWYERFFLTSTPS